MATKGRKTMRTRVTGEEVERMKRFRQCDCTYYLIGRFTRRATSTVWKYTRDGRRINNNSTPNNDKTSG
jgi:hypothetical protein